MKKLVSEIKSGDVVLVPVPTNKNGTGWRPILSANPDRYNPAKIELSYRDAGGTLYGHNYNPDDKVRVK